MKNNKRKAFIEILVPIAAGLVFLGILGVIASANLGIGATAGFITAKISKPKKIVMKTNKVKRVFEKDEK